MAEVRSIAKDLPASSQQFKDILNQTVTKFQTPVAKEDMDSTRS